MLEVPDNKQSRFENLFKNKVVLFGVGVTGTEILKVLSKYFNGVSVSCFCDSFKEGFLCDLPIISPTDLLSLISKGDDHIVVVCALGENRAEISSLLYKMGIPDEKVYSLPEIDDLTVAYLDDPRIDDWYGALKSRKHSLIQIRQQDIYLDWWCPEHCCCGDVLVYQPGKVGSVTICISLSRAGVQVTHVHMLTEAFIFDLIPELAWQPSAKQKKTILECEDLFRQKIKKTVPQKIITLVRDPIGRDVSHFFYHLNILQAAGYLLPDTSIPDACANGVEKRATQNGKLTCGYQFEWFDAELKAVFGVDVFDHPFDKENGYALIRQGDIEVLVIKLERLNRLQKVVGEFVGLANFELENANEASAKSYRKLYRKTKRNLNISKHVLSMYYEDNRRMDHFYSAEEKAAFRSKWCGVA